MTNYTILIIASIILLFIISPNIPSTASVVPTNATIEQKFLIGGDVNGDGTINIVDSLLIMQHTVKLRQLVSSQFDSADVNKDGVVDITDALFVAQFTVGTRRQFLDLPTKDIVTFAESNQLSQIWWKLTQEERWDISTILIDDFQNQIGTVYYYCEGRCELKNTKLTAPCKENAIIRQNKFNGLPDNSQLKSYFYKNNNGIEDSEHSFYSNSSYNLPAYLTIVSNPRHAVVALQINENNKDFGSWRFFQYSDNNIKVGSQQMFSDVRIQIITKPAWITQSDIGISEGDYIEFYIDSNGVIK